MHCSSGVSSDFSSIPSILSDARSGRMFILVDNPRRENEGDLVVLAEKVEPKHIAFMVNHGTGIVCLAMTVAHMSRLGLNFMEKKNVSDDHTAFTTSIDARYSITTGVSAEDRSKTILTAIKRDATQEDIVTPGHVFPIIANEHGLQKRAGHTEAAVEIAKLSGMDHSAVICELVNSDGSMMRLPCIMKFSKRHDIKFTTIDNLVEYIKQINQ